MKDFVKSAAFSAGLAFIAAIITLGSNIDRGKTYSPDEIGACMIGAPILGALFGIWVEFGWRREKKHLDELRRRQS